MLPDVVKYRLPVRILHWTHSGAFIILLLTGLIFFIPALGPLAGYSWTRLVHRAAAAVFIIAPVLYLILKPKSALRGLKQAFTWGSADAGWFRAAPRYFFLGDEKNMPPQGILNSGQKMWWLLVLVFGLFSAVTGLAMWSSLTSIPPAVLRRIIFIHDISFIVTGAMFILHVYLGVFHPLTAEALKSMTIGKISAAYARKHHGRWYEEITKSRNEKTP